MIIFIKIKGCMKLLNIKAYERIIMFDWINKHKKKIIIGTVLAVVVVPVIIHIIFKIPAFNSFLEAEWSAGDMLTYYGALLAGVLAIIGVFLTVMYSQRQYREDMINRILPYLVIDSNEYFYDFNFRSRFPGEDGSFYGKKNTYNSKFASYKESNYKTIYIMIAENISIEYELDEQERDSFIYPLVDSQKDGVISTGMNKKRYFSQFITNCGSGTAVGFNISIKKDDSDSVETMPIPICPNEKVYIAFCITSYREQIMDGTYLLTYKYFDIYENMYIRYQKISLNKNRISTGLFLKKEV
jgi:hypothetical protein